MYIYVNTVGKADSLFVFPMMPESIDVQAATRFQSYSIMNIGEVKLPLGEELTKISWSGLLPGYERSSHRYVHNWINPKEIQSKFSFWRNGGSKLHLMVTETTINQDVYVESYTCSPQGGYGDIGYSISFVAAKDLIIKVEGEADTATVYNGAPYVVKQGDSLWKVAQKTLNDGNYYPEIYAKNQALIDARNATEGGTMYDIYAGQVLLMPIL